MKEAATAPAIEPDKLGRRFTPAEAAEELGLSVHTLASWRSNYPGKLHFFRTGAKGGRVFLFSKAP